MGIWVSGIGIDQIQIFDENMAFLQQIIAKPDWKKKIRGTKIVKKWREELAQQGVSEPVFRTALQVLKKTKEPSERNVFRFHKDSSEYPWHLELGIMPGKIWRGCRNCKCMICSEDEYILEILENCDEDDIEYIEVEDKIEQYRMIQCKCVNAHVKENLDYLQKSICYSTLMITRDLKQRFIQHVEAFENRKPSADYHPGSNGMMRDIIHPSLYCYVRDVTPVVAPKALQKKAALLQWIPSEFSVIRDEATQQLVRTEIRSYINNLGDRNDPINAALYQDIEEIFTAMVPGFENILEKLKDEDRINALQGREDAPDLKLRDCQVIVKIARTELTTAKREFSEGSWHLEGIDEERIIATGIYYYDMKNIEDSFLQFRSTFTLDDEVRWLDYPQNCFEYVRLHYGLSLEDVNYTNGANTVINLGQVPTHENLCLFFPNFLQHRVSTIRLQEGCETGHRSILVFFLVNPFERTLSTANIPTPQQAVISIEDARLYREMLMFERKYEYGEQDKYHQRLYSLCEH